MTPAEQRINDYLAANTGHYVSAWDISIAAGLKDDRCARVMIHRLRHARGVRIASRPAPTGGYQLAGPSA